MVFPAYVFATYWWSLCYQWLLCLHFIYTLAKLIPFIPKSDQYQISPAASPEILHHTVWRAWLSIAYSDARWLYYQLLLPSVIQFSLQGWENAVFELGSERVKIKVKVHICYAGECGLRSRNCRQAHSQSPTSNPFTPKFKSTFSQPFREKCISEVVRISSIIIFHLRKLWRAKFFILCDVAFWWGCKGNLSLITLGSERVKTETGNAVIQKFAQEKIGNLKCQVARPFTRDRKTWLKWDSNHSTIKCRTAFTFHASIMNGVTLAIWTLSCSSFCLLLSRFPSFLSAVISSAELSSSRFSTRRTSSVALRRLVSLSLS